MVCGADVSVLHSMLLVLWFLNYFHENITHWLPCNFISSQINQDWEAGCVTSYWWIMYIEVFHLMTIQELSARQITNLQLFVLIFIISRDLLIIQGDLLIFRGFINFPGVVHGIYCGFPPSLIKWKSWLVDENGYLKYKSYHTTLPDRYIIPQYCDSRVLHLGALKRLDWVDK